MTHIINGMAGNLESHSEFSSGQGLTNVTAVLNKQVFGFSKMTVVNSTALKWEYVKGNDGSVGDQLWLIKPEHQHHGHGKSPVGGKKPSGHFL